MAEAMTPARGVSNSSLELRRRAAAAQRRARLLIETAQRLTGERGCGQLESESAAASLDRRRQLLLSHWPYARLAARLDTLPTIEQAKGVIMAQSNCTATEAFAILRRASQRSNVPVRELAARIVASAAKAPPEYGTAE
jgi:ANTAR domain